MDLVTCPWPNPDDKVIIFYWSDGTIRNDGWDPGNWTKPRTIAFDDNKISLKMISSFDQSFIDFAPKCQIGTS